MKKAKVSLRETGKEVTISITDSEKPEIHSEFTEKWQRLLNLLSKVMKVPAGLIMRITEENMEVFLKSTNEENPYEIGGSEKLGSGLYCETVLGTDSELILENANASDIWKTNPDVSINMISYYGLPIKWPDGQFYGTLCVLDVEPNMYEGDFKLIMREFKQSIEKDLEIMCLNKELKFYSEIDALTGVYNRRYIDKMMAMEFERCKRGNGLFSIAMLDLDHFKKINDTLGHNVGDCVLRSFSRTFQARIRSIDVFGRFGGDEFLLICPGTSVEGIETLIDSVKAHVLEQMRKVVNFSDFSYGVALFDPKDEKPEDILMRADANMYAHKRSKKS